MGIHTPLHGPPTSNEALSAFVCNLKYIRVVMIAVLAFAIDVVSMGAKVRTGLEVRMLRYIWPQCK